MTALPGRGFLSLMGPLGPRVVVAPCQAHFIFRLAELCCAPACEVAEQPVLTLEQLMKEMPCGALLCPRLRGGKQTRFVGSPWATENRVNPFPWRKVVPTGTKGGKPPQAAFILAPQAPTTTLMAEGRVKPLNHLHLLNPHARQGTSPSTAHAVPLPHRWGRQV